LFKKILIVLGAWAFLMIAAVFTFGMPTSRREWLLFIILGPLGVVVLEIVGDLLAHAVRRSKHRTLK
jgi:hypothetical protein